MIYKYVLSDPHIFVDPTGWNLDADILDTRRDFAAPADGADGPRGLSRFGGEVAQLFGNDGESFMRHPPIPYLCARSGVK